MFQEAKFAFALVVGKTVKIESVVFLVRYV